MVSTHRNRAFLAAAALLAGCGTYTDVGDGPKEGSNRATQQLEDSQNVSSQNLPPSSHTPQRPPATPTDSATQPTQPEQPETPQEPTGVTDDGPSTQPQPAQPPVTTPETTPPTPTPTPVPPPQGTLSLKVSGIKRVKGQLCYSLFERSNSRYFADPNAPASAIARAGCVPVSGKSMQVELTRLPPGTYAVAIYHDANGNGAFDKRGIFPAEDFGFSRNPPLGIGAPSYESCQFDLREGSNEQSIKLIGLG